MTRATGRTARIVVERQLVTRDALGSTAEGEWIFYASFFAEVFYGSGQERRAAAQEQATVPASFVIPAGSKANSIAVTDRIQFEGAVWNIKSNLPTRRAGEARELTALCEL